MNASFALYRSRRHLAYALSAAALLLVGAPVHAQYQWRDANGSMVFSDRPPPPGAAVKLVKAPAPAPAPVKAAPGTSASTPAPAVSAPNANDKALTEKVKLAAAADKAREAAEKEQFAKDQARHCDSLRENLRLLDSGERISRLGKSGEREFLSDAEKQSRLQQTRGDLAKHCK